MHRHDIDSVSLLFGCFFLGVVTFWLFDAVGVAVPGAQFIPVVFIVAGIALAVPALRRRAARRAQEQPVERQEHDQAG